MTISTTTANGPIPRYINSLASLLTTADYIARLLSHVHRQLCCTIKHVLQKPRGHSNSSAVFVFNAVLTPNMMGWDNDDGPSAGKEIYHTKSTSQHVGSRNISISHLSPFFLARKLGITWRGRAVARILFRGGWGCPDPMDPPLATSLYSYANWISFGRFKVCTDNPFKNLVM